MFMQEGYGNQVPFHLDGSKLRPGSVCLAIELCIFFMITKAPGF